MKYGISYKGSKSRIADDILSVLPSGKRFVDLFGGGFAMSHAALLSGKYESVLYNDIDPLLVQLIKDAIGGKYDPERFKPEWISREAFNERKHTDGYVKYLWSFGNNGRCYLFGRDKEEIKRKGFEYAVNGVSFDGLPVVGETIRERRLHLKKLAKEAGSRCDLEPLERMQSLERLESLERLASLASLASLERLEMCSMDFKEYEYREGDIVYCDPPYANTDRYGSDFDTPAFLEWAATRPYTVYVSEYNIDDPRFTCIWEKEIRSTLCASNNTVKARERLYKTK